ncbi:ABC transporter permease [Streptomyces sp. Wh19]|nr:ABC transporter permease [Streptomyces sp. Wh19]MDV9194674.1 ABC transporter permease [Streptomyces sp. Wh19]
MRETNLLLAMSGSFLTLAGTIVLAPLLSRPLVFLAGRVTTRFFGVSGKLARENALRNPRRTAATASALMIGLTLITGLTVAGHSVDRAMSRAAVQGLTADYRVANSAYLGLDPKLADRIADVPGVAGATPLASAGLTVDGEFALVSGLDPKQLDKVADIGFTSGSAAALGPGRIAVSETYAGRAGLRTGDIVKGRFDLDSGKPARLKQLTVVGVYAENRVMAGVVGDLGDVLPYAMDGGYDSVLVKAEPGRAAGLDREIRSALGDSPLLKVQSREQITGLGPARLHDDGALAAPGPVPRPGRAHRHPRLDLAGRAGGPPEHAAGDQLAVNHARSPVRTVQDLCHGLTERHHLGDNTGGSRLLHQTARPRSRGPFQRLGESVTGSLPRSARRLDQRHGRLLHRPRRARSRKPRLGPDRRHVEGGLLLRVSHHRPGNRPDKNLAKP